MHGLAEHTEPVDDLDDRIPACTSDTARDGCSVTLRPSISSPGSLLSGPRGIDIVA